MTVENAYNRWAESYDTMSNKTRDLDLIATRENLNRAHFPNILEIGCGTGKNTSWLCLQCSKLVAVDFSEAMLMKARQKIDQHNIEWQRFDISSPWPFHKASFDLITFNLVLEHISDLDFVFTQAASRLAPGGMIHLSELHPFKQYLGSKARFETGEGIEELEVFTHHIGDFMNALSQVDLRVVSFKEWFDVGNASIPRLLTILAKKQQID